jgi:ATP-dependent RNA helicase RhlE
VRVQAFEVSADRRHEVLQQLLSKEKGRCLVFARTKRGAEKLARNLSRDGFAAAMIHGGCTQSQRSAALAGFQQGRYRVLVATDLASRGIHVQDIAHVINYDLPDVAENFIHRVGRTGRAGEHGVASTFFAREQRAELFNLEKTLGIRMERIPIDEHLSGNGGHLPRERETRRSSVHSVAPAPRGRMVTLPGEVLQAQMGS